MTCCAVFVCCFVWDCLSLFSFVWSSYQSVTAAVTRSLMWTKTASFQPRNSAKPWKLRRFSHGVWFCYFVLSCFYLSKQAHHQVVQKRLCNRSKLGLVIFFDTLLTFKWLGGIVLSTTLSSKQVWVLIMWYRICICCDFLFSFYDRKPGL